MYDKHQPIISQYGRENCDNFAAVLRFVVVTIQNRLFNCQADCLTVSAVISGKGSEADEQAAAGVLYGHKRQAVETIEAEKALLYFQAQDIVARAESDREAAAGLLALFASIPGLGLVKAGFCCQLLYGLVGCIDSHNAERFEINPNHLKSDRYKRAKTYATRQKHINFYLDLCEKLGGCESLWNESG